MSSFVETKKIFPRDDPFPLKFGLQVTYPLLKAASFDTFCLVAPQPQEIQKEVNLLWSPYVIGQTIYIFMPWFVVLLLSSSFFPRLISAAADWMSAILPHMVWP